MNTLQEEHKHTDQEIEDELTCSICLDLLIQPVSTNCGHTFCKECLNDSLAFKKECTICREPIMYSSHYIPINITLQKIIEKKYPVKYSQRKQQIEKAKQEREESKITLNNIPVMLGGAHMLPGTQAIFTVSDRKGMDLVHYILRGNRRFVLMRAEHEMRGFVVELKRVHPTMDRSVTHAEVEGVDRFVADSIYIPEERRGLYMNEQEALKFANGRILKDQGRQIENEEEERQYNREIEEKLNRLELLFTEQFNQRATPEQINNLRATFGEYPKCSGMAIVPKAEKQSLYVLNHLELQNTHRDLIFSTDPLERLNACLRELSTAGIHQKLFVWEPEVSEKKMDSNMQLLLILALFGLLLLAGYLRR